MEERETTSNAPTPAERSRAFNTTTAIIFHARDLMDRLYENEGVTDEQIEADLDAFLGDSAENLGMHSMTINAAEAEAKRLKEIANKIRAQASKYERISKTVREHARGLLEARVELLGWEKGRRVDTDMGAVYLSKRDTFEIIDAPELLTILNEHCLDQYVRTKQEINKSELKASFKQGVALPADAVDLLSTGVAYSVTFK